MKYFVIYERASDGGWGAYSPDMAGVGITARTQDEARERIRGAIAFHIEGLIEDGSPVPPPSGAIGELLEITPFSNDERLNPTTSPVSVGRPRSERLRDR